MPKPPLISHKRVVRAFQKAGFRVVRQGPHISMWNEEKEIMIIVPRSDPVNPWTLKGIIEDAGMTVDEFRKLA
ncbi:MAG: type II toxin-antitoxin system HicA family toxin [Elusimicrobia bacterium]|nr:type II toxin-antitoxin system HicA family toxin [Elusimicrobiota bacterium]